MTEVTLLVASTGGHLAELHHLAPRLPLVGERMWVTFDTPQSRSLLAGERVFYAPYASTRDVVGTMRDARVAWRLLREYNVVRAISTGASIAGAFLPLARLRGVDTLYIECATRTTGPSVTGRLLAMMPGINVATQHNRWTNRRWAYHGSIFDPFTPSHTAEAPEVRRLVVSLGAHDAYGFRRLVERLAPQVPADVEVLWQVGSTNVDGLSIDARSAVPFDELAAAVREADAVVTHAGTGAALLALEEGHVPVYVPRRKAHGEHVDDHQVALAEELQHRGLAISREADEITWEDVVTSAGWTITKAAAPLPPLIRLGPILAADSPPD